MPAHVGAGVPANINKHRGLSSRGYDVALGRCNHLYSVAALTNAAGSVVERYRYSTFGERTVLAADGVTTRAASNYGQQIGFTGRYEDKETKLWYFRARYYSGSLGRFVSRDPLEYIDGMGLYAGYFMPNNTDPYGLAKKCCTKWAKRRTILNYPETQQGRFDCMLDRFKMGGDLEMAIYEGILALGLRTGGSFADIIKSPGLKAHLSRGSHVLGWTLITKMLNNFGNAGIWCREEKCIKTTGFIYVTRRYSTFNPCRLLWDDYISEECPSGSDEVETNKDGEAWRPGSVDPP
jgi:RHS repeat-associated protein